MEALIGWLVTPMGIEFSHAVIGLLIAVTAWVTFRVHRQGEKIEKLVDGHLAQHAIHDEATRVIEIKE